MHLTGQKKYTQICSRVSSSLTVVAFCLLSGMMVLAGSCPAWAAADRASENRDSGHACCASADAKARVLKERTVPVSVAMCHGSQKTEPYGTCVHHSEMDRTPPTSADFYDVEVQDNAARTFYLLTATSSKASDVQVLAAHRTLSFALKSRASSLILQCMQRMLI